MFRPELCDCIYENAVGVGANGLPMELCEIIGSYVRYCVRAKECEHISSGWKEVGTPSAFTLRDTHVSHFNSYTVVYDSGRPIVRGLGREDSSSGCVLDSSYGPAGNAYGLGYTFCLDGVWYERTYLEHYLSVSVKKRFKYSLRDPTEAESMWPKRVYVPYEVIRTHTSPEQPIRRHQHRHR
jgi:hypothetical protein